PAPTASEGHAGSMNSSLGVERPVSSRRSTDRQASREPVASSFMAAHALNAALISMHTNPFASPGTGDVGGMNVVVQHGAAALAQLGHRVNVFIRRSDETSPEVEERGAVRLHRLRAGPARPATKAEQEKFLPAFSAALRAAYQEAGERGAHWDVVHSHH